MSSIRKPTKHIGLFLAAVVFLLVCVAAARASDITSQKVIDLTNASRSAGGEAQLRESKKLDEAAEEKANDMIANDYFAHTSPQGLTPWHWIEKEEYDYSYAGENLAMDFKSADRMHEAWMASPTHRANILNKKFTEIGIAVKEGRIDGHETVVVVQMFGSGDKLFQDEEKKEMDLPMPRNTGGGKISIPYLPAGQERGQAALPESPIITSPQINEVFSSDSLEVAGLAKKGERVVVLDGTSPVAVAEADDSGWFQTRIADIGEGNHQLRAVREEFFKKENPPLSFAARSVNIKIDRTKPDLDYSLFAFSEVSGGSLVRLETNKSDSIFEIDGKDIKAGKRTSLILMVPKNRLSANVGVRDSAGNVSRREINLTNFYQGSKKSSSVMKIAGWLVPSRAVASSE